jgi:AraC-like DNA-binding protein
MRPSAEANAPLSIDWRHLVYACFAKLGGQRTEETIDRLERLRALLTVLPDTMPTDEQRLIQALVNSAIYASVAECGAHINIATGEAAWTVAPWCRPSVMPGTSGTFGAFRQAAERAICDLHQAVSTRQKVLQINAITPGDPRILRALSAVSSRYTDPTLTLTMIAGEQRLSVWHLSRIFKRHCGVGFSDHLHRTRVAVGCSLLVETQLSIKEIAAAVGYGCTTHFDRHFKRIQQSTPKEYRAQLARMTRTGYERQEVDSLEA